MHADDSIKPERQDEDDLDALLAGPLGSDPQDGCMFLRPILLDTFARELLAAVRAEAVTNN